MKKITVTDSRTSEILNIEYDSENRKYSINGVDVIRQQPLESSEDEFVFSASGGIQRLYHVLAEEIKKLSKS